MKNRLTIFFVLILTLLPLAGVTADGKKPQIYKGLNRGDRITVILKNDISYTGVIKSIIKNKIELDISYDDPTLKGSMSFRDDDIENIVSRVSLSPEEKEKIITEKAKASEAVEAAQLPDATVTSPTEPAPVKPPTPKTAMTEEMLLKLLDKFPPGDLWNDATYHNIEAKNAFTRTDNEKEFFDSYEFWKQAQGIKAKKDRQAFYKKYPATEGWGEEKYQQLKSKRVRLGMNPTTEEQFFVNNYSTWMQAHDEYLAEHPKEATPADKGAHPSPAPPSGE